MSKESEKKRIVTLGGGTGTFVTLSALKTLQDVALTAIVSSADDGGSTGHLRDAYGFLPAGDARQALVALAKDENVMRDLFAYRFAKGNVAGHNLGNLFLTALTDLLGSDAAALREASRILRVKGNVVVSTDVPATLRATLADGSVIEGEHAIDLREPGRSQITDICFTEEVAFATSAREAIQRADTIILGPGDLYTSTAAVLIPRGARETLSTAQGKLVYVMNLFTKAGQTDGFSAADHIREIARYAGREPDRILMHAGAFPDSALVRYAEEGELPVVDDLGDDSRIMRAPLASIDEVPALPNDPVPRSLIRHDPALLAETLKTLI
jgi:uncharacterized cofD-like protein